MCHCHALQPFLRLNFATLTCFTVVKSFDPLTGMVCSAHLSRRTSSSAHSASSARRCGGGAPLLVPLRLSSRLRSVGGTRRTANVTGGQHTKLSMLQPCVLFKAPVATS